MTMTATVPEAGPAREALKAARSAAREKIVTTVHHSCQLRELEWASAGIMLWWSYVLMRPGALLAQPGFAAFHKLPVTETQWAWVFGVIGACRCAALYVNGRWPRTPYIRIFGAMFGVVTWPQISYMVSESSLISFGDFLTTGTGVYLGLAIMDVMAIFRASRDARYYTR